MCSVRSANRFSMCGGSVQIRLVTSCSSISARCMNDAKLAPSPTGSRIVNRTVPAGSDVRNRSIAVCNTAVASTRVAAFVRTTSDGCFASGTRIGKSNRVRSVFNRGSGDVPDSICSRSATMRPSDSRPMSFVGDSATGDSSLRMTSVQSGQTWRSTVCSASDSAPSSSSVARHARIKLIQLCW